ncbi:MAG: hypothetical protein HYT97_08065 [Elusimicrobia bacterium]|nr:hypothetical protein [Elusimicrobiota bacterium]
MKKDSKGIILIGAILTLLVLAIFLPAFVYLFQNETKWSVKQKKTSIAFHMAEQGLDRGVWKMQESDAVYTAASTGAAISGYNFDIVYASTGLDGGKQGEYKVKLTTGSVSGRVIVRSIGRDKSTDEVRALEAEYYKSGIEAGMQIRSNLDYKSGTRVHWGPIVCYGDVDLPNSPDNNSAFPRKMVKGYLDERTPTSASGPHGDSSETWDGTYDYYCHSSNLDQPPTIDLDSYRTLAKNSSVPSFYKSNGTGSASSSGRLAASTPTGSGYFPATEEIAIKAWPGAGTYTFSNSTSVIFLEADYSLDSRDASSQIFCRAFIAPFTTLSVNGATTLPNRTAKIPSDAQKEYLYNGTHGNSTLGWSSAQDTNATAFSASGAGNNFIVSDVLFHAYCYFENISNSGTNLNIIGVLDMAQATNPQSISVYYDADISTGILTLNQKPTRRYWREINTSW